jgi:transcriptional regulator NrdR family protein
MKCTKCGSDKTGVTDSRGEAKRVHGLEVLRKPFVYRRRRCECGHRFTTYELAADDMFNLAGGAFAEELETLRGALGKIKEILA